MENLEYIESEAPSPSAKFFPSLKSLGLNCLPKLKGWWKDVRWMENEVGGGGFVDGNSKPVSLPSFPKLCHLCILGCDYVKIANFPPWSCTLKKFVGGGAVSVLFSCMKSGLGTTREGFEYCASSLVDLDIEGCSGLENMPVEHLSNLKSLILSDIGGSHNLDGIAWEFLLSLTSLTISHFQVVILPKRIQYLTSLQSLHIRSCWQLESLGEGLTSLTSLQHLQIEFCPKLKLQPEALPHLTSLTTLKIKNCPELTSLPEATSLLTSLTKLEITDCPRLSPPETMRHLNSLTIYMSETRRWRLAQNIPLLSEYFTN